MLWIPASVQTPAGSRVSEHWLDRTPSALKRFFDTGDYPVMDPTVGRPYPAFVHRNSDTTGAMRAIESIT